MTGTRVYPEKQMNLQTDCLPDACVENVGHVTTIIREGFAIATKPKPRKAPPLVDRPGWKDPTEGHKPPPWNLNRDNPGQILRIVLFGDATHTDTSQTSGYDILVEINQKKLTHHRYWKVIREQLASLPFPVYLHVEYARKVNRLVRDNDPFYTHVFTHGILLYHHTSTIWSYAAEETDENTAQLAESNMKLFLNRIKRRSKRQRYFWKKKEYRLAGCAMRHTVVQAYHMLLTIYQGYSYPEHDIAFLRKRTEALVPDLAQAWQYQQETFEDEFELLRHAYTDRDNGINPGSGDIDDHDMSRDDIATLTYRQKSLLKMVQKLCKKKIDTMEESTT